MRIKFSIVIPVGFIGFCGVFILLLVNAERAKREQERDARQARKMYVLIKKEEENVKKLLATMLRALREKKVEEALSLYGRVEESLKTMEEFIERIPRPGWRVPEQRKLDALKKGLEGLHDALSKGDAERAGKILEGFVKGRKRHG